MRRRFCLEIAYEGTEFRGWQRQEEIQEESRPSISSILEAAVRQCGIAGDFVLHGSGRTDVGVHARMQTAHLELETRLEPATLQRALNSYLPPAVRVLAVSPAAPDFHAQRHVRAKTYRYFILEKVAHGATNWPFLERWAWYVTRPLDHRVMREALALLVGKHDFAAFQNVGTPVAHTVREIFSAELVVHDWTQANPGDLPWLPRADSGLRLVEFRLRGKGFLKQMVRNIVGTLVEAGKGKLSVEDVRKILESKSRKTGGPTAPAHGLILDSVEY